MRKSNCAIVIVKEEAVKGVLRGVLESLGCCIRAEISDARSADFSIFDNYFYTLGVAKALRRENPVLPMVLLGRLPSEASGAACGLFASLDLEEGEGLKNRVSEQLVSWFRHGQGRTLIGCTGALDTQEGSASGSYGDNRDTNKGIIHEEEHTMARSMIHRKQRGTQPKKRFFSKKALQGADVRIDQQEIDRIAYELYEKRGCERGHDWEDWFSAEEIIRKRSGGGRHER